MNIIDDSRTTTDWQGLRVPWIILPTGACEQHGPHLPLCTDTVKVAYFARVLARELGAGLLPAIPILQSYEHSGFRGTMFLRPETAMAIVRDIADETERQGFTRLVILNGHGGNFALPTVVRDINRVDRGIKIVLINYWEYDTSEEGRALRPLNEIHAGAWETSVMLALFPERVGEYENLQSPAAIENGFKQSDLNLFGLHRVRPVGAWGEPAKASAEAGRAIVASIETNLVAAVRQRFQWLDEDPRYAGPPTCSSDT